MNLKKVNDALKTKIVLCTGTAPNRRDMLLDTYKNDIKFFPFKKIFLSTTDPKNMNVLFEEQKPVYELFQSRGQQLDCLNCVITSIKNAINDPEVSDEDLILFKHESYFIKDMHLIRKAVGTIVVNNYDMVIQTMSNCLAKLWYLNGSFFIKVSAAKQIFKNLSIITQLPKDAAFCELYLTNYVFNKIKRPYTVECHFEGQDNRLGFYHIPTAPMEPWKVWDKTDYEDLFGDIHL